MCVLTEMQAEPRIQPTDSAIVYNVFCRLPCSLILIAGRNITAAGWIGNRTVNGVAGHQYRDLSAELCQLKRACAGSVSRQS